MKLTISGVMDLPDLPDDVALISLRDPGDPTPEAIFQHAGPLLSLIFHDTDGDSLDTVPETWHLTRVRRFLETHPAIEHLHVHCFAGISRSPAVASFALALRAPEWTDAGIVAAVLAARPQAQPNPLLLQLIDEDQDRRLTEAWRDATEKF